MTDPKQIAIDKAHELSESQNSAEMRERERRGLRKPLKFEISDEWCMEMADREAAADKRS